MGTWRVEVLDHRQTDGWANPEAPGDSVTLAEAEGGRILAEDQDLALVGADKLERWRHRCAGRPRAAYVSADRLLTLTDSLDYHPWGFLGPALLFDLADGRPIAELRGEQAVSAGGGRFLLGLEGYGVFDTWLHDRDGTVLTSWHSYGHYVPDPDGTVRVVECDRHNPTSSHVVRLLPDGTVQRGPGLAHGTVPAPVVLADGTIVLLDAGVLRAVDRALKATVLAELLPVPPHEAWRFDSTLVLTGDRLSVTVRERSAEVPITHLTRTWSLAIVEL